MTTALHPFCQRCGWRKGGIDSWDGNRCKCGHYGSPMSPVEQLRSHDASNSLCDCEDCNVARLTLTKVSP